jgi:hypothetical protein
VQEDVPVNSVKPTQARAPVLVPRTRPGPVTLATVILGAEVALGLFSGILMLLAAGTVPAAFADAAAGRVAADTAPGGTPNAVEAANIDSMSNAIKAVLLGAAVITLLLSVVAAALVVPVARGSWSARIVAYALAVAAGCSAMGSTSYTAFGQNIDWAGAAGRGGGPPVGQAYADAMPGWLVGAVGGLTDLQVLGYIAVSVLLMLPVVRPYFRRRATQPIYMGGTDDA